MAPTRRPRSSGLTLPFVYTLVPHGNKLFSYTKQVDGLRLVKSKLENRAAIQDLGFEVRRTHSFTVS